MTTNSGLTGLSSALGCKRDNGGCLFVNKLAANKVVLNLPFLLFNKKLFFLPSSIPSFLPSFSINQVFLRPIILLCPSVMVEMKTWICAKRRHNTPVKMTRAR